MKRYAKRGIANRRVVFRVPPETDDLLENVRSEYSEKVGTDVSLSILMTRAMQVFAVYLPTAPATIETANLQRLVQ